MLADYPKLYTATAPSSKPSAQKTSLSFSAKAWAVAYGGSFSMLKHVDATGGCSTAKVAR